MGSKIIAAIVAGEISGARHTPLQLCQCFRKTSSLAAYRCSYAAVSENLLI